MPLLPVSVELLKGAGPPPDAATEIPMIMTRRMTKPTDAPMTTFLERWTTGTLSFCHHGTLPDTSKLDPSSNNGEKPDAIFHLFHCFSAILRAN